MNLRVSFISGWRIWCRTMKFLLITLSCCFGLTSVLCAEEKIDYIQLTKECGDKVEKLYVKLCEKVKNDGKKVIEVKKKCIDYPEKLKKLTVSLLVIECQSKVIVVWKTRFFEQEVVKTFEECQNVTNVAKICTPGEMKAVSIFDLNSLMPS